jgi:threonine dehydratase
MSSFTIEVHSVTFTGNSQQSISFSNTYTSTPSVVVVTNSDNINAYVENITTTGATIRVSDDIFKGTVQVQVIGI